MNTLKNKVALAVAAGAMAIGMATPAQAVPVALELALVIDVSGSVDANEYTLQRNGYVSAFQSAQVIQGIESFSASGGIAASVFFFSDNVIQPIGWTQLVSGADSLAFATAIGALGRPSAGVAALGVGTLGTTTNIAEGIDRARLSLLANGFEGSRQVIDVSGDGRQNTDREGGALAGCSFGGSGVEAACIAEVDAARDDAGLAGITVNGLAITNDVASLDAYYQTWVITPGGFALDATFATFASAVQTKIGREITGVPEPGTLGLLGLALAGLGVMRRRRQSS